MSRKTVSVSIGPSRPRNRIVLAIIGGLVPRGLRRQKPSQIKRSQAKDRMDLDQRVRESGEW